MKGISYSPSVCYCITVITVCAIITTMFNVHDRCTGEEPAVEVLITS
jgi:hypothetical protein